MNGGKAEMSKGSKAENVSESGWKEDLARVLALLGLVCIGLLVVLWIFLWPALLLLTKKKANVMWAATAEAVHMSALISIPYPYLYLHRKAFVPLRMMLMPLVNEVSKSEAIREKAITWYNNCADLPHTRDAQVLLSALRGGVRRDLKKKLKIFHQQRITTQTRHSDYLSFEDFAIVWEHEQRAVEGTHKSLLEEFIKRFLVVFLVTNAYIDRYYDANNNLCALGLFVSTQNTLSNFVYFCATAQSRCGIWQYHHFRSLLRATAASPSNDDIRYVNFHVHQDFAKQLAGCVAANYTDEKLLNALYPFHFYKEPPEHVVQLTVDLEKVLGK